ncbi:MAG: hypothetical protein FK733_09225 [Asgard group archaeon]|nr:hypothetical protein [Asgard group archaeon]
MTEKVVKNTLTNKDKEKQENEIRSNLRYCWQRAIAFATVQKATIQEVKDELEESFLAFIPINNTNRNEFRLIISQAFNKLLGRLFSSHDIANVDYENEFIELAIKHIKIVIN